MAELDRVREEIAYLKYWQGIFVVTDISLIGWLLSGSGEVTRPSILAFVAVVMLSFGIWVLHRQIERRIRQIGTL